MRNNIRIILGALTMIGLYSCQNGQVTENENSKIHLSSRFETSSILNTPESVQPDPGGKFLYVSNINGEPQQRNGTGYIATISWSGRILKQKWSVGGLNAPKGMGIYRGNLYVADLNQLGIISLTTGKLTNKITIKGSDFLNDITISPEGMLYVSDSQDGKIYQLNITQKNSQPILFRKKLNHPNGLTINQDTLFFVDSGALYFTLCSDRNEKNTEIVNGMDPQSDGLQMDGDGGFFVSSWTGIIYAISPEGNHFITNKLIDTRKKGQNAADILYNAERKTLLVPTFNGNTIHGYNVLGSAPK